MKHLIIAGILSVLAFSAQAEVNPEYMTDRQIDLVNELYPDDKSGSIGAHSWVRLDDGTIISVPTRYGRMGKDYFKDEMIKRIEAHYHKEDRKFAMFNLLLANGFSADDATVFLALVETK